jgi:hypothetical protein
VMFQRAVERGELPRGTDIELVFDFMLGSAQNLIIFRHEHYSDDKLEQIVDLILLGAAHGGTTAGAQHEVQARPFERGHRLFQRSFALTFRMLTSVKKLMSTGNALVLREPSRTQVDRLPWDRSKADRDKGRS